LRARRPIPVRWRSRRTGRRRTYSIQLRTRGHSRRNPRTCEFAPLRLELPKDKTKGTIFEGHGNIKLGVHCQSEGIYQQYMLKEYLANRLHNTLTPRSLRVRLARVTYADTDPGKKPNTRLGIFFEDIDDLAKRMEGRELPVRARCSSTWSRTSCCSCRSSST